MTTPLDAFHALLQEVPVASLAVRGAHGPDVSLVPFILRRSPLTFVLYVSELSAHTTALRADAVCALLLRRELSPDDPRDHHAVERATVHALARFVPRDEAVALGYADAWGERFPRVSPMILPLKDFHFVALTPSQRGASFVQGFGRAFSIHGEALDTLEHVSAR